MFLFVATALAGTNIGWPCQRLNWGWRNVWSTCSINSFAPAATTEATTTVPTGFRYTSSAAPTIVLNGAGWYQPTAATAVLPQFLCNNAAATGSGFTANLRNRCRRAIDAYGALVKSCQAPNGVAGNRGPNSLSPDFAPAAGHQPHVTNVQGLTVNAQLCLLPAGLRVPGDMATPSTTCPGLLGWFTVVFNACGFTNAPGLTPAQNPNGYTPQYFPLGSVASASVLPAGAVTAGTRAGYFCAGAGGAPDAWNAVGATFRTSRCRKALDQFGRTASRCHMSSATLSGPAQAGGYSDPLRLIAVGAVPAQAPASPAGINVWAPACN